MYNDLKSAIEFFKNDKFAASTGVEILSVEKGRAVCALEISQGHVNSDGFVQGGAIFTLADSAFAVAANLGTADDCCVVTTQSNINFLSSAATGRLVAEAVCVRDGHSVSVYNVTVSDETNNPVAFATFTGYKVKKIINFFPHSSGFFGNYVHFSDCFFEKGRKKPAEKFHRFRRPDARRHR
ncbi:MAG: PaaI family thioesterase [Clostridium sp.]|nr:MAG: PaaI family thioesterase [Clostridium sp.]